MTATHRDRPHIRCQTSIHPTFRRTVLQRSEGLNAAEAVLELVAGERKGHIHAGAFREGTSTETAVCDDVRRGGGEYAGKLCGPERWCL